MTLALEELQKLFAYFVPCHLVRLWKLHRRLVGPDYRRRSNAPQRRAHSTGFLAGTLGRAACANADSDRKPRRQIVRAKSFGHENSRFSLLGHKSQTRKLHKVSYKWC